MHEDLSAYATVASAPTAPRVARASFDVALVLAALATELLALLLVTAARPGSVLAHPSFVPLGPAVLAGLALLARPTRRLVLVAGLAAAFVPLYAFFAVSSLAGGVPLDPRAPPEFIAILLTAAAFLLAFPAALMGYSRRGATPSLARGLRTRHGQALVLGLALLVGASGASALAWSHASSQAERGTYDVPPTASVWARTDGLVFAPTTITVRSGELTEIAMDNPDPILHTISYEKDGRVVRQDLLPGTTTRFLVQFDEAGTIPFWCDPHSVGHRTGMIGAFVVT